MRTGTGKSFTIDTDILFYSIGTGETEKKSIAKKIVDKYLEKGEHIILLQVLGELVNAVRNKYGKGEVLENSMDMARQFLILENVEKLPYGSESLRKAMEISSGHNKPFWDCLIAATMIENGVSVIYTENVGDYEGIAGIKAVNPFKKKNRKHSLKKKTQI